MSCEWQFHDDFNIINSHNVACGGARCGRAQPFAECAGLAAIGKCSGSVAEIHRRRALAERQAAR
jgi:hypothetical protein